ncbi:MAG TPA: MBL fold metallo-hydrolase [Thermomicrobiales bacterium]|nr:MBL fold metallo-hydrolase [Thermomicrobiales bacterium]
MAEIRWLGHTCVRIKAREAVILMDPVDRSTGYGIGKQAADIVTLSNDPRGRNLSAVRPDYKTIDGPGEYELQNVFVTGARSYQNDAPEEPRIYNTMYVVEVEGLKIGHLGNVGHTLSESQAEPLEDVDILVVPVGGDGPFSYDSAVDLVTKLAPKVVIPVRYQTEFGGGGLGDLVTFCKKLGMEPPAAEDKYVVKPSDLGETTQLVVLKPDSDPVKR